MDIFEKDKVEFAALYYDLVKNGDRTEDQVPDHLREEYNKLKEENESETEIED